jgi:chorismate mutase
MTSVKDFETWITSYKDRKQKTFQMRPTDGALLVMDSKNNSKVIKTFPVRRGYDLFSLLRRPESKNDALEVLKTLTPAQEERIALITETFQRVEKELLSTIEERRHTADPMSKIKLTQKVGELQRGLELVSEELQTTLTPVRYPVETEVTQNIVDVDTKKKSKTIISIVYSFPYTFEERTIEGKMA